MRVCPKCKSVYDGSMRSCPADGMSLVDISDGPTREVAAVEGVQESLVVQGTAVRYSMVEPLGQGGWGTVYKAYHHATRRLVALKILRPEVAEDPEARRRFHKEVEAISRLRHPNTVTLFDFGEDDQGRLFMAMEYVEGRRLDAIIQEDGPLEPLRAIHIAVQIARALEEAHGYGIVHRDIKPQNTIITSFSHEDTFVKVLDFGVARFVSEEKGITLAGTTFGTPEYMSPEQVQSNSVDHRADLYSLGVMIYEMLSGAPPFTGRSPITLAMAQAHRPPPPLASPFPVPRPLRKLLGRLLSKSPDLRPQSARDVVSELESVELELRSREPPRKGPVRHQKVLSGEARRGLSLGFALLVFLGFVVGLVALRDRIVRQEHSGSTLQQRTKLATLDRDPGTPSPEEPTGSPEASLQAVLEDPASPNWVEVVEEPVPDPIPAPRFTAREEGMEVEALSLLMRKRVDLEVIARDSVPEAAHSTEPEPSPTTQVPAGKPQPDVSLRVAVSPVGTDVLDGDSVLCRTPCIVKGISGSARKVRLSKQGYQDRIQWLFFDESRTVSGRLKKKPLAETDGLKGTASSSDLDGLK